MIVKIKKLNILAILLIIIILVGVVLALYYLLPNNNSQSIEKQQITYDEQNIPENTNTEYDIDSPNSQYVVVNKNRPIPLSYIPQDLITPNIALNNQKSASENTISSVMSNDLISMFEDSKLDNINIMMASGYRSSDLQAIYYNSLVRSLGPVEADLVSAKPGTSEHQTGLALDIAPTSRECYLEACFADTKAGSWLKDNAHKYGFILRYPLGKEEITGYQFEPWHFRYVGKDMAQKIYSKNATLEEYFNL